MQEASYYNNIYCIRRRITTIVYAVFLLLSRFSQYDKRSDCHDYIFTSFKTTHVGPNYIRKVNDDGAKIPGFISLAVGNPSADAIPSQSLRQQIEKAHAGQLAYLI